MDLLLGYTQKASYQWRYLSILIYPWSFPLLANVGLWSYTQHSTQQLVASANYSYHHKQNFISYGGSHPKGSNKTNGSSRSPGHNKITQRYQPKCQFRDQIGHIAKSCPRLHCSEVTTNCATTYFQSTRSEMTSWLCCFS